MIIQLQPEQLVDVWPAIQVGVEQVGRIISVNSGYMPNVLVSLLSGKFQLWAALNEQRETYGFIITCVSQDTLTKEEYLIIEMVYGFRKSNDEIVFETWECLKEFALAQGCEYIKANTNVARAAELLERVGFVETSRTFIARIK